MTDEPEYFRRRRMTPDEARAWRRYRYASDPEYRERMKKQAREGMQKVRAKDAAYQARVAHYEEWVKRQGSELCAICGQPEQRLRPDGTPRRLAIDHNHETGVERALLCAGCNVMIGAAGESPERLEAGAAYVRKHNGTSHNMSDEKPERDAA